jgi:myo-inositol 2-dehydrogenase / D-chiro-inositol 1-dehydrogenase
MTINIGIIGCGFIGGVHARNLASDPRVKLAGVADVALPRAEELARTAGCRAFSSAADLMGAGLDAVYVTTPNTLHTEAVLAALEAGLHVFSEKPMATTFAEAQQIRAATQKAKGIYQVGHNRRFAPVYTFCRDRIAEGFTVTSAHMKMNRGELKNPPWTSDTAVTGGFLYETPVHLFDVARYLIGEVVEVECRANSRVYPEMDNFSVLLAFAGGQFAALSTCAHTSWAFPFEQVELYGPHTQIVTQEMEKVSYSPGLGQDIITHDYFQMPMPQKWGYAEEDQRFIDSIIEHKPALVTAEDGYRTVELIEAVYRSALSGGTRIKLPL